MHCCAAHAHIGSVHIPIDVRCRGQVGGPGAPFLERKGCIWDPVDIDKRWPWLCSMRFWTWKGYKSSIPGPQWIRKGPSLIGTNKRFLLLLGIFHDQHLEI